jgi:nucleoside-diphosphate-sugar epimerase
MMKLAITGVNGRLGQAFSTCGKGLSDLHIVGLSRRQFHNPLVESVQGSLLEVESRRRLLKGADVVLHLAAYTQTSGDTKKFIDMLMTNALGTAMLVRSLKDAGGDVRLIHLSTAHVYQLALPQRDHFEECRFGINHLLENWIESAKEFLMGAMGDKSVCRDESSMRNAIASFLGVHPVPSSSVRNEFGYCFSYEISKLLAESLASEYPYHFILRPTYLYGGSDGGNEVARLFDSYFQDNMIRLWVEGRDFMHYEDCVDLFSALMRLPESQLLSVTPDRVLNCCTGQLVFPNEVEELLAKVDSGFGRVSDRELIRQKRRAITLSNGRGFELINRIRKKDLKTSEEGFREMLYGSIIKNMLNAKLLKHFVGGSAAHAYLIEDGEGDKMFKISAVEGAENGSEKISAEVRHARAVSSYIRERRGTVAGVLPLKILSSHSSPQLAFFTSEYLTGTNMGGLVLDENVDKATIIELFCNIQNSLLGFYALESVIPPENFFERTYLGRVKRRLEGTLKADLSKGQDLFKRVIESERIAINGVEYRSPQAILNEISRDESLCKKLSPKTLGVCLSGDPIPDNVLFGKDGFRIIDPRGDVVWAESGVTKKPIPFYDPAYDVGKMAFYFAGWKMVREEEFELRTEESPGHKNIPAFSIGATDVHMTRMCKQIQSDFLRASLESGIVENLPPEEDFLLRLGFITATHFLADTHPRMVGQGKNKQHQALAMYLLGTIMLNRFVDSLGTGITPRRFTEEDFQKVVMWQENPEPGRWRQGGPFAND